MANLSNLAIEVLGNSDLQQIIVRYEEQKAVFYLQYVNKQLSTIPLKSLDMTYLNTCPRRKKDCEKTTKRLDLDCTSYRRFVASFRETCDKSPESLQIKEGRGGPSIPWEKVLSEQAAKAAFSCVTQLLLNGGGTTFLVFAISIGSLGKLKDLYLRRNNIGDAGMSALSGAIASGSLGKLEYLGLGKNDIGNEGMKALASAITSRSLPNLQNLWLQDNRLGDAGMTALSGAIASGSLPNLLELHLSNNQIGDKGMEALAGASGSLQKLWLLSLCRNQIGDEGMVALQNAITNGSLPSLEWIDEHAVKR